MKTFGEDYIQQLHETISELDFGDLQLLADRLHEARMSQHTVFIIGNGGSASTASHFACDLGKGASVDGAPRFRAIALTDNIAHMTAIGNDLDYESLFSEQLENLSRPDDVLLAISASGNSPNIIKAVDLANERGLFTVGLIGFGGGLLRERVNLDITVGSTNYGPVEDLHLVLDHMLAQYLRMRAAREVDTAR